MKILKKIPVINNHLTIREIGEDIIILSEEDLEIHNLERSAAFIWMCIDGKTTLQGILKRLCDKYDVSVEQAKNDIIEFFKECENKNLISFLDQTTK